MSYRLRRLDEISPADRARFEADGFLVVEGLLELEHIEDLRGRFRTPTEARRPTRDSRSTRWSVSR